MMLFLTLTDGVLRGNSSVIIDNTAPTIPAITLNAVTLGDNATKTTTDGSVSFDIDYIDDIDESTIDYTDFTVITSGTVSFDALEAGDLAVVSGPLGQFTLTVTNVDGDGTLAITAGTGVQDDAGNFVATPTTSAAFTIDNTAPEVTSIVREGGAAERTNSTPLVFTVLFDEDVVNLQDGTDTDDFDVVGAAGHGSFTVAVQTADTEFDVSVAGVTGDGLLDLDFDSHDIADVAGNAYVGTINSEETYTIDNTPPGFNDARVEGEDNTLDLIVDMDETGIVYYLVVERLTGAASNAPSAAQVRAGTYTDDGLGALDASGSIVITSTGTEFSVTETLTEKLAYDIYFVSEDEVLFNQSSVTSVLNEFTGGVTITAATWTDLCLDGASEVGDGGFTDIIFTERLDNDIKEGTGVVLLFSLPANFTFDDAYGSVSIDNSIINETLTFPAGDLAQITYDAPAGSLTETNTITISGLRIQAATATAGATNFTRFGGTANIYGANLTDPAFVLGTVSSKNRPAAPTITSLANGDVTNSEFRLVPTNSLQLTAGGAGGTYDWWYQGGTLAQGNMAVVTETELNGGSSFPDDAFSNSTYGLYTLELTETDGDACVSDAVDVNIAVFAISLTPNTTSFTDDDNTGTLVRADFPASDHSGSYSGPGLTGETIAAGAGGAQVQFVPSAAGIDPNHVVTYTLTRTTDNEEYEISQSFSVSDADESLFTNPGDVPIYYCETSDDLFSNIDVEPDPTSEPASAYFYELEAFESDGMGGFTELTGGSDPLSTPGSWSVSTPIMADLETDDWTFDPVIAGAGDFRLVRFFVPSGTTDPENDKVSLGNVAFKVIDLPTVDLESNLDDHFCVTDADETLVASITHGANTDPSINFTSYRIRREDTPGSMTFTGAYQTVASGALDFSAITDGVTIHADLALVGTESSYQIEVTSAQGDDPGADAGLKQCVNTTTATITIYAEPDIPELDLVTMNEGVETSTDNYLFEYCDATTLIDFEVSGQDATTKVIWYEDDGLGGIGTLIHEETSSTTSIFDLFGTTDPAVGTYTFHLTQVHYLDVSGFDGCESQDAVIQVEVHDDVSVPSVDLSGSTAGEFVTDKYVYEYCEGENIEDVIIHGTTFSEDFTGFSLVAAAEASFTFNTETWWAQQAYDIGGNVAAITNGAGNYLETPEITGIQSIEFDYAAVSAATAEIEVYASDDGGANFDFLLGTLSSSTTTPVNQSYDLPTLGDYVIRFQHTGNGTEDMGIDNITTSTVITNQSYYIWYEDDGTTEIDGLVNGTGDMAADGNISATPDELLSIPSIGVDYAGGSRPTPGTYTFYVQRTEDRNTAYPAVFEGCSSGLTQIDIVVYAVPSAPVAGGDFTDDIRWCSGDASVIPVTTLNAGNKIMPGDDIKSPGGSGIRYRCMPIWQPASTLVMLTMVPT